MDISKASNFERFIYDLIGQDGAAVRRLWQQVDRDGVFDLAATPHFARVAQFGFVSGRSTHADRLATIRSVFRDTDRSSIRTLPMASKSGSSTARTGCR